MALQNPCNLNLNPVNTGVDCSAAMAATSMIILVPKAARFTIADITTAGSFTAFLEDKISAAPADRWFPIGGANAPVRAITDSNETDVIETLDDGSMAFVRYGMYNRTLVFTDGGLCLAQRLMAFPRGYSFIEVDIKGQVLCWEPTADVFGGIPTNLAYGPAPEIANLKTTYKNKLFLSFSPLNYIQNSKLFSSDSTEDILNVNGLLDAEVGVGTTTQTTTNIYVTVTSECSDTDLVALFAGTGAGHIAQVANFVVTNANGTTNTPSAAAMQGTSQVKLTGTFATGTNITVALAAPSVLKTNGVEGYEGRKSATVPIP
jgi:hypothetical protein